MYLWQCGVLEGIDGRVCPQEKLTCLKSVLVSIGVLILTYLLHCQKHECPLCCAL